MESFELPEAFCARMRTQVQDFDRFVAAYQESAVRGLRVNRRFIADEALLARLGVEADAIPYQEGGYYYTGHLGAHPLHSAGAFYLQEPSAMLTANAIDWAGDECVLDLCAAPGGKSTAIAAALTRGGVLVANEIDLSRAKILLGNIERMGIANAVVTSLPPAAVARRWGARFDVVVVDAPCSGEGMFRKNPAAIAEWSEANVAMCAARQKEVLDAAAQCVKEGGRLVYSTCTFAPQENEENVRYLLASGAFVLEATTLRVQQATVAGTLAECRRMYPHLARGEGHFVAVLRRVLPANVPPKTAPLRALSATEKSIVRAFWQDVTPHPEGEVWAMVGKSVCSMPQVAVPFADGALAAGVRVGEIVKGRLEPHHMLFKTVPMYRTLDWEAEDTRVAAYLHGESVAVDAPAGYGAVRVAGCPLGGYKAVDGVAKNRYPKGLRQ